MPCDSVLATRKALCDIPDIQHASKVAAGVPQVLHQLVKTVQHSNKRITCFGSFGRAAEQHGSLGRPAVDVGSCPNSVGLLFTTDPAPTRCTIEVRLPMKQAIITALLSYRRSCLQAIPGLCLNTSQCVGGSGLGKEGE
jgi:hypothetical protein